MFLAREMEATFYQRVVQEGLIKSRVALVGTIISILLLDAEKLSLKLRLVLD